MTSPQAPDSVKRYQKTKLILGVTGTLVNLVLVVIFALWIGPNLRPWVGPYVGQNAWLQLWTTALLLGLLLEAVSLPLSFTSSYLVEHRFGLSTQTLGGWIAKHLKSFLLSGVFGLVLVSGLYALIWWGGTWWWAWATAAMLAVTLVLGRLVPVLILPLFYKVTPLDDPGLLERFRRLAAGTSLRLEGVYRLHLSAETKKANAALTGLGRSRRVLLGDTLLDQYTPEEIEIVFAHELGHHHHRHLPKLIGLQVLITLVSFWLVDRTLRWVAPGVGYEGLGDPFGLALVMLVTTLVGLAISPAMNALSRYFEVQSDTYALHKTLNATAFRSVFTKLSEQNKSDPNPHPLVVWLFYDHPPICKRLALADQLTPTTPV